MTMKTVGLTATKRCCELTKLAIQIALSLLLFEVQGAAAQTCSASIAQVVSLEGNVELWRPPAAEWQHATMGIFLCPQDIVRVGDNSRAALLLTNETTVRLDQKTSIVINGPADKKRTFLDLLNGAIHVLTRTPTPFTITTPFVNANIEGTEFAIRLDENSARVVVVEGRISIDNSQGRVVLNDGETGIAVKGQPPRKDIRVKPADAVQWALHYPSIYDAAATLRAESATLTQDPVATATLQDAAQLAEQGKITESIARLDSLPAASAVRRNTGWHVNYAGLLLVVGRVDEARQHIDLALAASDPDRRAYALKAIIAVVQNERDTALHFATKATVLDARSAAAWIALSYALQARFQIDDALASARRATVFEPGNGLAWARLAELELSRGNLNDALSAAHHATDVNPNLAKTQTVLGFVSLTRMQTSAAIAAFGRAIELDSSDPLPRLGLGLAEIRTGDLVGGRRDIAIAASLDPADPLVRSYLGKAYFEEKRNHLAATQLQLAKELDPSDPTPWFYDAIRKQTENRPVEALADLEKSIALNENRAVYRSRLLLDSDRASRLTSIGKIYDDLAFNRFAVTEATQSLASDPANYSGHRFLSGAYAGLERHEIASVSELLQAQLLQPLNLNPAQPKLNFSSVSTPGFSGPMFAGFNEFNPVFERNAAQLTIAALAGTQATKSGEAIVSGLKDQLSYSVGTFNYQTSGFRPNSDVRHSIQSGFVQLAVSPQLNLQAEVAHRETETGDSTLNVIPGTYSESYRRTLNQTSTRFGLHWAPSIGADTLVSLIQTRADEGQRFDDQGLAMLTSRDQGYQFEVQQLLRYDRINVVAGAGTYRFDVNENVFNVPNQFTRTRRNAYVYGQLRPVDDLIWSVGANVDDYAEAGYRLRKWNPKTGIQWQVTPQLMLRAATFQTVKPALYVQRTIEPTAVSGFNQFFDDPNGAQARRDAIALDLKATPTITLQLEASRRHLTFPILADNALVETETHDERTRRLTVGWLLGPRWSLHGEAMAQRFARQSDTLFGPTALRTDSATLGLRYFHPNGVFARLNLTSVRQQVNTVTGETLAQQENDSEQFSIVDAALGITLPRRMGTITIDGKNLLGKTFRYQDANFRTPTQQSPPFIPARSVLIQLNAAF